MTGSTVLTNEKAASKNLSTQFSMPISILYISYTGLLDPLGQSQVLQYVLELARTHQMTLLTFEKPEMLNDSTALALLEEKCRAEGVDWHYLTYHRRPNMPATFYDVVAGTLKGIRLVRGSGAGVVHCRSYLAGVMGLGVKKATGAHHIFDMRGFWPDERVDGGIWQRESFRYRLFKWVERKLFLNTDHVVSLTRAGVREFSEFDYLCGHVPPTTVIPTCTNLEMFRLVDVVRKPASGFTLGYVGSAGSWYMFEDVARAVRLLFDQIPDARFFVINKGGHDDIRRRLVSAGVDLGRVEIKEVPFARVGEEIRCMDAGIFFIKPVWSKRASCPTRMGEFLACGKPCLANSGVGDVAEDLTETRTGVALDSMSDEDLVDGIHQLIELSKQPDIRRRCRVAAEERFSLNVGVQRYSKIYTAFDKSKGES